MNNNYHKSVVALANYCKFYGIDTEDEIVFKSYLRDCKIENEHPVKEVVELMNLSEEDNTVYRLPVLRAEVKMEISVYSPSELDEVILMSLPGIFEANESYGWFVDNEEFVINKINSGKTWLGRCYKKIHYAITKESEYKVCLDLKLMNKVNYRGETEDSVIDKAIKDKGYIPISLKYDITSNRISLPYDDIIIESR